MSENKPVITRIAPSPTGNLHIGTARSALFNFLFARHFDGTFIVRIEDTDKERSTKAFEENIVEGLAWLGLSHDGFFRQSERTQLYTEKLKELIETGKAYLSKEESRAQPGSMVEVVRLKNPNAVITFSDLIRGEISFDTKELGDMVIARALDDPLYHFTVVVDDALMDITHVIRGEDHISNTPRQILIQEALGFSRPLYAHIPLILAPDRSKLSKRKGAVSLSEYQAKGYLPQALINYLALLGWNPGTDKELFSLDELIEAFSLDQVQKGGAMFNTEKLDWFNHEHLKRLSGEGKRAYVQDALGEYPEIAAMLLKSEAVFEDTFERLSKSEELVAMAQQGEFDFYLRAPDMEEAPLVFKKEQEPARIPEFLEQVISLLDTIDTGSWTKEVIREPVFEYASKVGVGRIMWPLRVALTGREKSPDPFTVAEALGKQETLARIVRAIESLKGKSGRSGA